MCQSRERQPTLIICHDCVTNDNLEDTIMSESPVRDDLSGQWSHMSFLLDQDSVEPEGPPVAGVPKAMPKSTVRMWAKGVLDLKEERHAGENDTLKGQLTFPNGLKLQIRGRRVPNLYGDVEGIVFEGTGSVTNPSGVLNLKYDLVGTLSFDWRENKKDQLTITGSIRAAGFDPWAPTGAVGAFVLVPI
jgi:hypothetical protein